MTDPSPAAEGVRQRNLARLLRLVHLDGPLSRAALTEATGLNRSTIADLVAELAREGLVEERAPDPSRRVGRPSPVVAAAPRVIAAAVNPEVDAVTLAAIGLDREIVLRERIDVDHLVTPEETAAIIAERIAAWREGGLSGARIVAVGLAVPGLVRAADGLVRDAPHLHWTDAPVRDLVTAATGLPTVVGNDASLGAVAEHLYGAARGIDHVVYLNGGASGIGGGLIVHGMPVAGAGGYAGEFGQNRPGIASNADRRAGEGVLEDEVSRARLLAAVRLSAADEPTLAAALAASDQPDVTDELTRQRGILATALANAVNVLNPSVVVLGGFLATLAEHDVEGLTAAVGAQAMTANMEGLDIRVASLAEDRLLIGAAEAAFERLLADPSGASSPAS
ncbi:ROK family transcriptional regulator [Microbacterium gallinarum]|jgi:predicted NBD/HSP70 family sugar kinase|uniref:ROK family transcriptional regulator n=1 Tax=Microbacterium gallinarum TaxID=2762209 RepID=A0ABR8X5U5_9MICO|nr:ROK family transcriptional regulator [Microbacterium gallinarum]MBD8024698.1 ROK family transcriptional regulator [Microbacterium gallinarum]